MFPVLLSANSFCSFVCACAQLCAIIFWLDGACASARCYIDAATLDAIFKFNMAYSLDLY